MKHNPRNILWHEIIGLKVEVIDAKNPLLNGIKGIVVDETKNLVIIATNRGIKKILKEQATFKFTLPNGIIVKVEGKLLKGRPEDRLRLVVKRRW